MGILSVEKQMRDLIFDVFLKIVYSVFLIEFSNQCLYRSQRFKFIATNFCLKVIDVSKNERDIDRRWIVNTHDCQNFGRSDLNRQLSSHFVFDI